MKLIKYGVTLKRLCEEDLELLRTWRNSDFVQQRMEYREEITPEMQMKWFQSINNPDNYYYIIIHEGKKIGLINEKGFDRFGDKTSESGIFLADPAYQFSLIPVFCSLILLEMSFFFLGGRESYIHVLKDNKLAISYNKKLGYVLCPGQEHIENQKYVLTRKAFIEKTRKLRKAALKISNQDPNLYLVWEPIDYESGLAQESEELIKELDIEIPNYWENNCHIYYYPVDPENPEIFDRDPSIANPYKYYKKK